MSLLWRITQKCVNCIKKKSFTFAFFSYFEPSLYIFNFSSRTAAYKSTDMPQMFLNCVLSFSYQTSLAYFFSSLQNFHFLILQWILSVNFTAYFKTLHVHWFWKENSFFTPPLGHCQLKTCRALSPSRNVLRTYYKLLNFDGLVPSIF